MSTSNYFQKETTHLSYTDDYSYSSSSCNSDPSSNSEDDSDSCDYLDVVNYFNNKKENIENIIYDNVDNYNTIVVMNNFKEDLHYKKTKFFV